MDNNSFMRSVHVTLTLNSGGLKVAPTDMDLFWYCMLDGSDTRAEPWNSLQPVISKMRVRFRSVIPPPLEKKAIQIFMIGHYCQLLHGSSNEKSGSIVTKFPFYYHNDQFPVYILYEIVFNRKTSWLPGIIVIRPSACSTIFAMHRAPSRAVFSPPLVRTRLQPRAMTFSNAL